MGDMGGIKILVVAVVAFTTLISTAAAAPSLSNSGSDVWKYQLDISIKENSGTTLTDYQVLIEFKGTLPGEVQSNGADIRFTDSKDSELNYWIESWDYSSKNAKVWVKVPSIPASASTTIRMYYGNPSASSMSNGDKTFEFFDDFEGTSIDETKWYINFGRPSISDGILSLNGESVISEKVRTFGYNYIFESRSKMSDTGNEPRSFLRSTDDYTILDGKNRFEFGSWTNRNEMSMVQVNNGVFSIVTNSEKFPTSFEVLGMVRFDKKTEAFRQYIFKLTNTNNIPDKPLYLQLYSWGGETHYVDWARVRQYISPSPTVIIPGPTVTPSPTVGPCGPNASVSIHGERTNVALGEDILLKLSAVNLITKPVMHVQVIIIPPSGMSVTSSDFVESGAGQYTTTYELEPGKGRDIEVRIISNQVGDLNVNGRIIYYFNNEKDKGEDCTLNLPIKVRGINPTQALAPPVTPNPTEKPIPGFGLILGMSGLLGIIILKRKW